MSSSIDLPSGQQPVTVSLINCVNFGPAIIKRFMAPPVPGLETFATSPSLSFLVEHPSGQKLIFDLGIRKDYHNYSASIASYLPSTKYDIQVEKDVAEILQDGAISLSEINAVIWRYGPPP
jgi:hypothetical protein